MLSFWSGGWAFIKGIPGYAKRVALLNARVEQLERRVADLEQKISWNDPRTCPECHHSPTDRRTQMEKDPMGTVYEKWWRECPKCKHQTTPQTVIR